MYYFEQYAFLKSLFNYKLEKVQDSAILGAVVSAFVNVALWLTGAFKSFSENSLGVGVAFVLMIFVIMIIDLITGLCAAKKRHEEIKSKKGLRWVVKFGSYLLFVYILNCFSRELIALSYDWLEYPLGIIKIYVLAHIAIWEIKSIDENFESLGYSLKIFKLADPIFKAFRKSLKDKAGDSGINVEDDNI